MQATTAAELDDRIAPPAGTEATRRPPVFWWASAGAALLVFILVIWMKWVTGPYFHHVNPGPSVPPTWMKVALIAVQAGSVLAALATVYYYIVRPWRQERRFTTDGMLTIGFFFMWFQDVLPNYQGLWFTYNSSMVNMGSWGPLIPGWHAFYRPGADPTEPLLFVGTFYVWGWIRIAVAGSALLRRTKARWPRLGDVGACVLVLFPVMTLFDVLMEGIGFEALGAYVCPGGGGPQLFPASYNRFPIFAFVLAGLQYTVFAALRFYTNDKGETLVERGASRLRCSPRRKTFVRFLALAAGVQSIIFVCYILPSNIFIASHPTAWPAAVQSKSYFTNHLCGDQTNNICPQPGVPLVNGNDTVRIGPDGQLVIPANGAAARLYHLAPGKSLSIPAGPHAPRVVRFNNSLKSPFDGPLFGG